MKKILFVLATMGLVGGCGGGADELLGKMKSFKNEMCKCKDKACVEKVEGDMLEWMMKNAEKFKNAKPSKSQEEQADKISDEMEKCKEKATGEADEG